MLERGIVVSYETVRRWALKFGPAYARRLRRKRRSRRDIRHLDEAVIQIAGKKHWLWRAVDQDGYVLDEIIVTQVIDGSADASHRCEDCILNCWNRDCAESEDLNSDNHVKAGSEWLFACLMAQAVLGNDRPKGSAEDCQSKQRALGNPPHPFAGAVLVPRECCQGRQVDQAEIQPQQVGGDWHGH